MPVHGARQPTTAHVAHTAAIWSPLVRGCIGLSCGRPWGGPSGWTLGPGTSPRPSILPPRQALCRGLLCSHLGLSWAPVCTAWEMGTGTLVSSFLSLGHRSAGNPSVFSQSFCPPVSRSEVWPGSRGQKWPQVEGD